MEFFIIVLNYVKILAKSCYISTIHASISEKLKCLFAVLAFFKTLYEIQLL